MLRGVVGTDNFWKGIKNYYKKYKDSNATTTDFRREMEEVSGLDLSVFFQQWLYKPGALELAGQWNYDPNEGQVLIQLDQVQTDGSLFDMPLEIGIHFRVSTAKLMEEVRIDKRSNVFKIKVEAEPKEVVLDPNLWVLMTADFKGNKD